VEYGLVGTPDDYRMYGAGLLSSLGEGHFLHEPAVRKLPLTAACTEVPYDITRPQPQLFVVRDFEQLERVLEDVEATLSTARGGVHALREARASAEPATFELDTGAELCGVLRDFEADGAGVRWLELEGPCTVGSAREVHAKWPRLSKYVLPLGVTSDGRSLSELSADEVRRRASNGTFALDLQNGLRVSGRLLDVWEADGRALGVLLADFELRAGTKQLHASNEPYPLLLARSVRTAAADMPRGYFPETEFPDRKVPKPRTYSAAQKELIALQEQASAVLRGEFGQHAAAKIEAVYKVLESTYPDEWLLRWNLLEALVELGLTTGGARAVPLTAAAGARGRASVTPAVQPLGAKLQAQLEKMEIRFAHREPIATGLRYLRARGL
jgi:phenylalanine-4-hydroxylase